jgi:hypothetical protein
VLLEALAAVEPLKHDECCRDSEPVAGDVFESLISERYLSWERNLNIKGGRSVSNKPF